MSSEHDYFQMVQIDASRQDGAGGNCVLYAIGKLPHNASDKEKSDGALDISTTIRFPPGSKCDGCSQLIRKEIYQCSEGHTLRCTACSSNFICQICTTERTGDGVVNLRNRLCEQVLDTYFLYACTYKRNGCLKTFHRTEDTTTHLQECIYADGRNIDLCCQIWSPEVHIHEINNPVTAGDVIRHLFACHGVRIHHDDSLEVKYDAFGTEYLRWSRQTNQNAIFRFGRRNPVFLSTTEKYVLVVLLVNPRSQMLWFFGIGYGSNNDDIQFKFKIEPATDEMDSICCTQPILTVEQASKSMANLPLGIPISVVNEHYTRVDGSLVVNLHIV